MAMLALVSGCDYVKEIVADEPKAEAPASQPAPAPTTAPEAPSQVVSVPPPPPPVPPPFVRPPAPPLPDFDPAKLIGSDKDEALAVLGQPNAVREQPPATVWTYRGNECALDLFFYMDLATRKFRVLTTEVTSDLKSPDARRACLNRLKSASRAE